jgi:UMF1 family MFS transporter
MVKLALHRPALRAWATYDWANSAVWTTVITAVFPVYFYRVAGAGLEGGVATARFAIATTVGMVATAILTPLLSVAADAWGTRKKFLAAFLAAGALATGCLFFVGRGDWLLALALFVLVEIGLSGSGVFYDALLPHVARPRQVDRLSTTGYALGYLGGGLLLALNLAWILRPGWFWLDRGAGTNDAADSLPARVALLSAAMWWVGFSIPLFLRVPEPPPAGGIDPRSRTFSGAATRLRGILADLRRYPQALRMLIAFLIYSDGIGTIIRMAAIYGTEVGVSQGTLIGSILLVQFVGIPFALLFGRLAGKMGTKPAITIGLAGYVGVAVFAYFIRTGTQFVVLALAVAAVQGGTQALSRSLFASLIPRDRSSEFFSFFGLSEKLAGFVGPGVFAAAIALTGSSRSAIVSVVLFFLVGGWLLIGVDVGRGRSEAAEAGRGTRRGNGERRPS